MKIFKTNGEGTLEEFEKACIDKYGNDEKENYSAQIKYLKSL